MQPQCGRKGISWAAPPAPPQDAGHAPLARLHRPWKSDLGLGCLNATLGEGGAGSGKPCTSHCNTSMQLLTRAQGRLRPADAPAAARRATRVQPSRVNVYTRASWLFRVLSPERSHNAAIARKRPARPGAAVKTASRGSRARKNTISAWGCQPRPGGRPRWSAARVE